MLGIRGRRKGKEKISFSFLSFVRRSLPSTSTLFSLFLSKKSSSPDDAGRDGLLPGVQVHEAEHLSAVVHLGAHFLLLLFFLIEGRGGGKEEKKGRERERERCRGERLAFALFALFPSVERGAFVAFRSSLLLLVFFGAAFFFPSSSSSRASFANQMRRISLSLRVNRGSLERSRPCAGEVRECERARRRKERPFETEG